MKKRLIRGAFAALAVLCLCVLSGCSAKRTIDLVDYVSVEFTGYNGDGSANVSIDRSAMLPLLDKQISPATITDSFEAGGIQNNGKLSNGDVIGVTINYNELLMDNAKVKVKNPTLSFTVEGLKEKQKLDVFAAVEFGTEGVSPECKINVKYGGDLPYGTFEIVLENGEVTDVYTDRKFKNGEKLTLRLTEDALERLGKEYKIDEISREYTVEAESAYILTAADLSLENRKALDIIAADFLDEKIEAVTEATDRDARLRLFSNVTGINLGTLYAGVTSSVKELSMTELKGAYVGVGTISGSWGVTVNNQKSVYYIYDADFSYYLKESPRTTREDDTTCALIVRIDDPKITPEGIMYSNLAFASAKDFETAYNSYITSSFEKLP